MKMPYSIEAVDTVFEWAKSGQNADITGFQMFNVTPYEHIRNTGVERDMLYLGLIRIVGDRKVDSLLTFTEKGIDILAVYGNYSEYLRCSKLVVSQAKWSLFISIIAAIAAVSSLIVSIVALVR